MVIGSKVGLGQAPGKAPAGSPEDIYLPRPPLTSLVLSLTEREHIVLATGEAACSQQKTANRPHGGEGMALRGQPVARDRQSNPCLRGLGVDYRSTPGVCHVQPLRPQKYFPPRNCWCCGSLRGDVGPSWVTVAAEHRGHSGQVPSPVEPWLTYTADLGQGHWLR